MTEYRIVTNGEKFRVQMRKQSRFLGVRWRGAWFDLGSGWPVWRPHEFLTREEADRALARAQAHDARAARGWWPVGPNAHDIGYPPLPEKLPAPPAPPRPPDDRDPGR